MPTAPFPPRCGAKYRPVQLLASGGFGHVWIAEHAELGRRVAVKLLDTAVMQDPRELVRFRDEARVTAALSHPSIVVVLDHDVEDGVPWIVYELLPGDSLRAHLEKRGRLSTPETIGIALQLAGALDCVHRAGILHRDLKPENVLSAEDGRWKLADFGIAKWAGGRVRTATGVIMGTPAYLAPELIAGKDPAPSSDLYALGAMLHETVAGAPPFMADNFLEILTAHASKAAPSLTDTVPDVPRALAQLVSRLLEKSPEARPATARELAQELAALAETLCPGMDVISLAGSAQPPPVASRPPPSRPRTAKTAVARDLRSTAVFSGDPPAPSRGRAGLGLAVMLGSLVAAGGALVAFRRPPLPPRIHDASPVASARPSPVATGSAESEAEDDGRSLVERLAAITDKAERGRRALGHLPAFGTRRPGARPPPPQLIEWALQDLETRARKLFKATTKIVGADLRPDAEARYILSAMEKIAPLVLPAPTEAPDLPDVIHYFHVALYQPEVQAVRAEAGTIFKAWAGRYPSSFVPPLLLAALDRAAKDTTQELAHREAALALYERHCMRTYSTHRESRFTRLWFNQQLWLAETRSEAGRPLSVTLDAWSRSLIVLAESDVAIEGGSAPWRLTLLAALWKLAGQDENEIGKSFKLHNPGELIAERDALVARCAPTEPEAPGGAVTAWFRLVAGRVDPPPELPWRLQQVLGNWLEVELDAIRARIDDLAWDAGSHVEVARRYLRVLDHLDALAPLLFGGKIGPWASHQVPIALGRLLHRKEIRDAVPRDPAPALIAAWKRRYPSAWAPAYLDCTILQRGPDWRPAIEARRAALALFEKGELGKPDLFASAGGWFWQWRGISDCLVNKDRKAIPALIEEMRTRARSLGLLADPRCVKTMDWHLNPMREQAESAPAFGDFRR